MPRRALDEILELPIADRLRAVEEIWETIVAAPDSLPVPESQLRELERRLKLHQEHPEAAEPWEVVRSRLLVNDGSLHSRGGGRPRRGIRLVHEARRGARA